MGPWPAVARKRLNLKAYYAWQPGAGQATTFGLWCGRLGRDSPRKPMAMLNWGRHNAQCLPVWKQSGPMLGAGCAHVGPSCAHIELSWAYRAYVGPSRGPCWAIGPILGLYWPLCWAHLGSMLGLCWDYVGLCWAYVAHVGPSWELCWGHVWAIYAETILRFKMSIFPPRARNLASRWAQYSFKTPQPCCANIDLRARNHHHHHNNNNIFCLRC